MQEGKEGNGRGRRKDGTKEKKTQAETRGSFPSDTRKKKMLRQ